LVCTWVSGLGTWGVHTSVAALDQLVGCFAGLGDGPIDLSS
jgi:hypothetical protein